MQSSAEAATPSPPVATAARPGQTAAGELPHLWVHGPRIPRACWLAACLLAALAQMALAGYHLGVGNQTIQIPFLKRAIDPALFSRDVMVNQTLADYPSFFYPIVAKVVNSWGLLPAYFWLHLATTFAVLSCLFALARGMFRTSREAYLTAAVAVLLVLAGHHQALAGDELYSAGFTHTYAVLPLAIAGLALAYRDRLLAAWVVTGILFNFHALTAAYLGAPLLVLSLLELKRNNLWKVAAGPVLAAVIASPTLFVMATHRQTFDALWITLTYVRSADHSFPSFWWRQGTATVPHFVLLMALAALSFSFPVSRRVMKTSLVIAGVIAALFVIGYVFSEIKPVPTVLRAQLFRASRLLLVVAMAHIAHGVVEGILAAVRGIGNAKSEMRNAKWTTAAGVLEGFAALATLSVVACPALLPLLPHAVVLVMLAALCSGRLSWLQAAVAAGAVLVALWAWEAIGFVIPGLQLESLGEIVRKYLRAETLEPMTWISAGALAGAALLVVLPRIFARPERDRKFPLAVLASLALALAGLIFFGVASQAQYAAYAASPAAAGGGSGAEAWLDVQHWAKTSTAKDALFITPPDTTGFRIFSERSVVTERRDGTQLYFTGKFAHEWWDRLSKLFPEAKLEGWTATSPPSLRQGGKNLANMSDDELLALAKTYDANYLVLPVQGSNTPAAAQHKLKEAYHNSSWVVYEPVIPLAKRLAYWKGEWFPAKPDAKAGTSGAAYIVTKPDAAPPKVAYIPDTYSAQDSFMREIVWPNIEKYRKSDASIVILDENGKPLTDAKFSAVQTSQRFDFGCSLPFFEQVNIPAPGGDYKPAPVTPIELERFKEAGFNFSMIPFSAKWCYTEPEEGKPRFSDLDKYVAWCNENHVATEFHFITGLPPTWLPVNDRDHTMTAADKVHIKAAVIKHAQDLLTRYGDKVKYWQVVNDWYPEALSIEAYLPDLVAAIRKIKPDAKLGLSDCATLTASTTYREETLCLGISQVRWLTSKGVKIDYFAPHAHKPFGLWPDAGEMYEAFDGWQSAGVKVHISEAFVPMGNGGGGRGFGRGGGFAPVRNPTGGRDPGGTGFRAPATQPATASAPATAKALLAAATEPATMPATADDEGVDDGLAGAPIYGKVRRDTWNRELQAEHFERFITICFSHPDVESINLWCLGPDSMRSGEGILTSKYEPTPAFETIKKMLHETFMTRFETPLPLDGKAAFRGYQGDYEVSVTLADGTVVKGKIALEPGAKTTVRLKVDRAKGTLVAE